ncbi:hypothetical protein DV096_12300 [Bradymonadaceae bacterium TMQ3]|uniref:Tetratricopeptide repeat protein n=1 Tax=Lujinxingia sediminis TaxID=2480984 RepID=A0ABY0CQK6_9DELT|nr:hypothetical protein [Lujinxingia sediminis]RDV37884.1 hypothetical protein DV096_12300 [Bradymonadaceae bacterium TMQ3]RVU42783.1 hypothetical protein EA187_14835 [Lujinxingia sediminis]TXC75334.1 hypothetical protein FRC91_11465 [Bradymonadales bacterium TMQ1]
MNFSALSGRRLLALLISASLLATPTMAFAQDDARARATQFYEQASEAYSQGHFARAIDLLERAFAHDQNLVYKYNQILAYQGLGEFEEALRVLDIYAEPMESDGRFDDILEIRAQLEEAIAEKESEVVKAPDEGETTGETPVEAPAIEVPPEVGEPQPNILAWSLIGAGGVALAGGALFGSGVLIGDTIERVENSTTPEGRQSTYTGDLTRDDDLDQLSTHRTLSVAFLAGGVVLGATGATLLLLDKRAQDDTSTLSLMPTIGPSHAGATFNLRF